MTDRMTFRTFPTAFKLAAIERLEAGEAVLPFARDYGEPAQPSPTQWRARLA